jgi:hypothetical protein
MKKTIITFTIICASLVAFSQKIELKGKVDKRAELMSIVFRLAGAEEFINNNIPSYSKAIDSCFEPYKNHPIVDYIKKLREADGVYYNAVMSMAVHLEINNDAISFSKDVAENSVESRWKKEKIEKFVELLNDFYVTSKFDAFYSSQQALFAKTEENFNAVLSQGNFSWLNDFFGTKPTGTFIVIISLSNGSNNYGANKISKNGIEDFYSFNGSWKTDSLGQPIFDRGLIFVCFHELCHCYINPIVDKHFNQMSVSADTLFEKVKDRMTQQAYNLSKIMMYELLNRSITIPFLRSLSNNDPAKEKSYFDYEKSNGFVWIEKTTQKMIEYSENRSKYTTMDAFMPEITKYLAKLAEE